MNFFHLLKTASSLWHRDILNLTVLIRFVLVWQSAHAQNHVECTRLVVTCVGAVSYTHLDVYKRQA